jgi:succinate dehydrogenase / fumarate reductase flavoprotein subunit
VARNVKDMQEGIDEIRAVRKDFWENVFVPGGTAEMNQQLEYAIRVADYLDLGELMCVDALDRDESCGAHYREDHLDEEGEAKRDDDNWCFVSAWEPAGQEQFIPHSEPLYIHRNPLMKRNNK